MILKCIASGSTGNSYALISNNEILLLECGVSFKSVKKYIDYQFLKIKGCLVSHEHQDHLKYVREYLSAGIPVYTNDETKKNIEVKTGERIYAVSERKPFQIGGFKIIPFYVPHNDTPNYAYLIEHEEMGRLLFATDYEYLPFTFKSWKIEHFLIECNYSMSFVDQSVPNYEHVLMGHASLQTCCEVIGKNKTPDLRNAILCHLSRVSGQAEYFTKEIRKVAGWCVLVDCAASGKYWELNREPF